MKSSKFTSVPYLVWSSISVSLNFPVCYIIFGTLPDLFQSFRFFFPIHPKLFDSFPCQFALFDSFPSLACQFRPFPFQLNLILYFNLKSGSRYFVYCHFLFGSNLNTSILLISQSCIMWSSLLLSNSIIDTSFPAPIIPPLILFVFRRIFSLSNPLGKDLIYSISLALRTNLIYSVSLLNTPFSSNPTQLWTHRSIWSLFHLEYCLFPIHINPMTFTSGSGLVQSHRVLPQIASIPPVSNSTSLNAALLISTSRSIRLCPCLFLLQSLPTKSSLIQFL